MPGIALLRVVQCFMHTAMAAARSVTRIAQQKLMGEDLSRLAPAGFDATLTNAYVVQAVALTAALRERLRALAGRPVGRLAPGVPKAEPAPQGRSMAEYVTVTYEVTPGDRHDWPALAKPWRMGPRGVAVALRMIAGKSNHAVVREICDFLRRAVAQLGAEADVARITALEEVARALCAEAETDAAKDGAVDSGAAGGAPHVRAAGPPADEPALEVKDGPPERPPDG